MLNQLCKAFTYLLLTAITYSQETCPDPPTATCTQDLSAIDGQTMVVGTRVTRAITFGTRGSSCPSTIYNSFGTVVENLKEFPMWTTPQVRFFAASDPLNARAYLATIAYSQIQSGLWSAQFTSTMTYEGHFCATNYFATSSSCWVKSKNDPPLNSPIETAESITPTTATYPIVTTSCAVTPSKSHKIIQTGAANDTDNLKSTATITTKSSVTISCQFVALTIVMLYIDSKSQRHQILFILLVFVSFSRAQLTLNSVPSLVHCCLDYTSDTSTATVGEHVTKIEFYKSSTSKGFYNCNENPTTPVSDSNPRFLGGFQVSTLSGVKGNQLVADQYKSTDLLDTVTLNWPTKAISTITVNMFEFNGAKRYSTWIFGFNDGTTQTVNPPTYPNSSPYASFNPTSYVFTLPSGSEFLGFNARWGGCNEYRTLQVQYTCSIPCSITSISITSSGVALSTQTYTDPASSAFTYQLEVNTATTCGCSPTAWSVQSSSTGLSETITSAGLFSVVPFPDYSKAGSYTISVTSVTINAVVYNSPTILNTSASPNLFILIVRNPCESATVTASTVADISVTVFQASAAYSPFTAFTYVDSVGRTTLCGGFTYSVSITRSTATNDLTVFTLNSATSNFQVFSDNLNQAGTFIATLTGKLSSYLTQQATCIFTITILNPCSSTTLFMIGTGSLTDMNVQVDATTALEQQAPSINNDVDLSQGSVQAICGGLTYTITDVTSGSAVTKFTASELSVTSSGLIRILTSNPSTTGTHTIQLTVTLTDYLNVALSQTATVTVTCTVNSIKAVSKGVDMTPQQYTLSATDEFSYQLTIVQIPNCNCALGNIAVTATGISGNQPANFQTIDASSALYKILPTTNLNQVGTYKVQFTSVSVCSLQMAPTLQSPNYFDLTVNNPCEKTIVTASTLKNITLAVWEGATFLEYNKFAIFPDSVTTESGIANYCQINYTSSLKSGTKDNIYTKPVNNVLRIFSLYTNNMKTIGVHTMTLTGYVNQFPNQNASTTFTITVTDPCLSTVINSPSTALSPMTTSVFAQANGKSQQKTQKAVFTDSVSVRHGKGSGVDICGMRIYSITSVASSASTALTSTELKINFLTGEISLYTENQLTIGTHTATVSAKLQNYDSVAAAEQQFTITIIPIQPMSQSVADQSVSQGEPPYFASPPTDQKVNQCDDETYKPWTYTIPKPLDKTNSTVAISVVQNLQFNTFFDFISDSKIITQKQVASNPLTVTIKIQLTNQLQITRLYSFQVFFQCNSTVSDPDNTFEGGFSPQNLKNKNKESGVAKVWSQKQWSTASVDSISSTGLMIVKFNQKMKVPDASLSTIQNGTVNINGTRYKNIEIRVIPGRLSDQSVTKISWQLLSFTSTQLEIKLNFTNPLLVSSNSKFPEEISVEIFAAKYFVDYFETYMYPGTKLELKSIPKQVQQEVYAVAVKNSNQMKSVVSTAIFSNFIVAFLISGPLQEILGSIRSLQIVLHSMLLDLKYPVVANVYFGMLFNVLTFQLHDFTDFFISILKLDTEGGKPFTDQFGQIGYGAHYIVLNFGTLCFTIFFVPIMYLVTKFLVQCCKMQLHSYLNRLKRLMFYNSWIQFLNETYLFLGVCSVLNYYYFYFDSYGNVTNSLISLVCGLALVTFPFFILHFYSRQVNLERIQNNDEEFMERFGAVFEGLQLRGRRLFLVYPIVSLLRKLFLICILVFLQKQPVFSTFAINFNSQFMIMLVGYITPFQSQQQNQLEIFNEVCVLFTNYHSMMLTDFISDVNMREIVGSSLVFATGFGVVINLGSAVGQTLQILLRKLKLNYLKFRRYYQLWKKRLNLQKQTREKSSEEKRLKKQAEQAKLDEIIKIRLEHVQKIHIEEQRRLKDLANPKIKVATNHQTTIQNQQNQLPNLISDTEIQNLTEINETNLKKLPKELHKFYVPLKPQLNKLQLTNSKQPQQQLFFPNKKPTKIATGGYHQTVQNSGPKIEAKMKKFKPQKTTQKVALVQPKPTSVLANEIFNSKTLQDKNLSENQIQYIRECFDWYSQNEHTGWERIEEQLTANLPPGTMNDGKIIVQFGQCGRDHRLQQQLGVDEYIFQEWKRGILTKKLQEYQKNRNKIRNSPENHYLHPSLVKYRKMDFGDWHPDMTIFEQGELYREIVSYEYLNRTIEARHTKII